MSDLVRAVIGREVEFGGRVHLVRSPTVYEVLTLMEVSERAVAGNETAVGILNETLRGWLPRPVLEGFKQSDYSVSRVVAFVFEMINQGLPSPPKRVGADEKPLEVDWDAFVAEYMATYGVSLSQAMQEPWNGFLLMLYKAETVHARHALRQLSINSMPYVKSDRERDKMLAELIEKAGGVPESTEEKRKKAISNQQAQLDKLAIQFQKVGARGKA